MGSSPLVSNFATAHDMNFKLTLCFCLFALTLAVPMPWIQGPGVSKATEIEGDLENPITGDEEDPHVYYIFRFSMTCGELCFTGLGCGACEEEAEEPAE